MQDHLSNILNQIYQQKFYVFENFIFSKFCPILFDFCFFYLIKNIFFSKNFVMNSVHEPCPKIDSGTVLSQNWVKNRLGAPSAQHAGPASPPRRAQARACLVVAWPTAGRVVAWPSAVSQRRAPYRGRVLRVAGRVASLSRDTL